MAVAAPNAAVVPHEPRRLYRFLVHYPRLAGAFAISVGVVVLIGWLANIRAITYPIVDVVVMVANTATMCLLAGISLWLKARTPRARSARVIASVAALGILAIASATLIEYALDIDLGVDRILPTGETFYVWPRGRPATDTALGFAFIALALLYIDRRTAKGRFPSDVLALIAGAIALVTLLNYLFGVPALFGDSMLRHLGMSLPAALVMLVLSIGILTVHIDRGALSVIVAPDAGGIVARELLAGLALFPPVMIAVILGARLGWYALPVASALVLFFALAEGSVLVMATARRMSRIDAEQHRVQDELRASEAWIRSLIDTAQDGILIADRDGRYTDANPAAAQMFGYTRDELVGKHITDVIAPSEVSKFERELAEIRTGKTTRKEWEVRRRDGSQFSVEVVANMLPDGRWQAICRDITERKAYRSWLRSIVDQLPEGVVVVDDNERVQVINRAMTAWAYDAHADAWRNPGVFDVRDMKGELVPFDKIPLVRALRTRQPQPEEELQLRQPDGTMIQIEAHAAPLFNEAGRLAGAVVVAHDNTHRNDLERLRDEWIAVIAHDLRQPLTAILVSVDMLHEHLSPQHEKTILDGLRKAADRLIRMVDDLLDDARISARQLTVERNPANIVSVVNRAVEQARMSQPDTTFEVDAPTEALALIDQQRIEQVMANLLSNAIKYRDPDTAIHVEVKPTDEGVRVGVFNRGMPIEQDELSQLFSRFHRTRSARGKPGIGLGLYVCKGLVEAHGGRIWVESSDGWTRFYFTVPAASAPPEQAAR